MGGTFLQASREYRFREKFELALVILARGMEGMTVRVCVDDFTASGRASALKLCWEAVRKGLELEDPKPMSQYFGRGL